MCGNPTTTASETKWISSCLQMNNYKNYKHIIDKTISTQNLHNIPSHFEKHGIFLLDSVTGLQFPHTEKDSNSGELPV